MAFKAGGPRTLPPHIPSHPGFEIEDSGLEYSNSMHPGVVSPSMQGNALRQSESTVHGGIGGVSLPTRVLEQSRSHDNVAQHSRTHSNPEVVSRMAKMLSKLPILDDSCPLPSPSRLRWASIPTCKPLNHSQSVESRKPIVAFEGQTSTPPSPRPFPAIRIY